MDAGEVQSLQIPSSPAQKFRLKMNVDDQLHGLIAKILWSPWNGRNRGDKFLLIHSGTEHASLAPSESTLQSKEPFEMTKLLEQAQGIMTQAGTTLNGFKAP